MALTLTEKKINVFFTRSDYQGYFRSKISIFPNDRKKNLTATPNICDFFMSTQIVGLERRQAGERRALGLKTPSPVQQKVPPCFHFFFFIFFFSYLLKFKKNAFFCKVGPSQWRQGHMPSPLANEVNPPTFFFLSNFPYFFKFEKKISEAWFVVRKNNLPYTDSG